MAAVFSNQTSLLRRCFGFQKKHFATVKNIDYKKDYYSILGVTKANSKKEIRATYFKAAKKYHPDVTQSLPEQERKEANARFIEMSQAYEILSDKNLKEVYDKEREQKQTVNPQDFRKSMYERYKKQSKLKQKPVNFFTNEEYMEWLQNNQGTDELRKEWRKKIKESKPYSINEEYNNQEYFNRYIVKRKQYQLVKSLIMISFGFILVEFMFNAYIKHNQTGFYKHSLLYKVFGNSVLLSQIMDKITGKREKISGSHQITD